MIGLSYEDIVAKIVEVTGKKEDEIRSSVKDKLNKLSGLISTEGAAHIVANELGVDLFEIVRKQGLKIGKISPGMRGICVVGKVLKIYETRSFKKEGREGKVASFLIGDDTGTVRIVLWDSGQIKMIEDSSIKDGVIVRLTNCYVRDNNGFREVHLGNKSEIVLNPEGIIIENIASNLQQGSYQRKEVKDVKAGEFVSIFGTIVQVFEPRFYEACPECGKKVAGTCGEHGSVVPKQAPVLNFYLDDGTGNIRTVAFRDNVYSILGVNEDRLLATKDNGASFEEIRKDVLGKQLMVSGKINKNEMFDRLECAVNKVSDLDPAMLANSMIKEIPQHDV